MKKCQIIILLCLGFLISSKITVAQTWSDAGVFPTTTARINTVDFYSSTFSLSGGYLGFNPVRFKSFDGGQNWSSFSSTLNYETFDFHIFSSTEILAAASAGVFRSTDGGVNFTQVTFPGNSIRGRLAFANATTGWHIGTSNSGSSYIYYTSNGGTSWSSQIPASFGVALIDVACFSSNNAWIVGEQGLINATTDGGNNWFVQTSGVTSHLNGIHFSSLTTGVAVGNNGVILRTIDGGSTWSTITFNTTESLNDVHFTTTTEGWIVGNNGTVLKTIDGGLTWTAEASGTTEHIYEVDFLNPFVGLAVGANCKVIRYQGNCTETNTVSYTHCGAYFWGGQNRPTSGQYVSTFSNQYGCDSTVTLNLTVLPLGASTITAAACDSYSLNGETYTFSGTFTQELTSVNSCDSIITLNLTITLSTSPSVTVNGNQLIAITNNSFTYQWLDCNANFAEIAGATNQVYSPSSSGSYTFVTPAIGSCPADTATCVQFCVGLNTSLSLNGTTLAVNQTGASYQWLDCGNGNAIISGATNQNYNPTTTGVYAVEITFNGCTGILNCTPVTISGNPSSIIENEAMNFNIYPNPANSTISVSNVTFGSTVTIIDVMGKRVSSTKAVNTTVDLSVETLSNGIYFVEIENNGVVALKKLVVSK